MGDTTYMQVTVYDCPTRRRQVARLLAAHDLTLGGWDRSAETCQTDPHEVAVGEEYTDDQASLGTMRALAGELIAEAPRCSFLGWEDPAISGDGPILGELIAYCPAYGRFDGECTANGDAVLLTHQALTLLHDAERLGWLDRDTMLRLHRGDLGPQSARAWEQRPGLREAIEVATAVPWRQDASGQRPARTTRLAWQAVIDANTASQYQQLADALAAATAHARGLGIDLPPATTDCPQVHAHTPACRLQPTVINAVMHAADQAEAVLTTTATATRQQPWQTHTAELGAIAQLRGWANRAETACQGRRHRQATTPARPPAAAGNC
jgi:hypothetical protein